MGSPAFALPSFQRILASSHQIIACVSQPARPKNRGHQLVDTAIAKAAKAAQIPLFTPNALNQEVIAELAKIEFEVLVVVAYGLIIPKRLLELAKLVALNLHPSALPRFRGAAPLERSLEAGDKETKVMIIKMVEALDAGPIALSERLKIEPADTAASLSQKASIIGADLLLTALDQLAQAGQLVFTPQQGKASYAKKITKSEALLDDFNQPGEVIINKIRAFNPRPGAYLIFNQLRYKILAAKLVKQKTTKLGLNPDLTINCRDGVIIPQIIQRQGGKAMAYEIFKKRQKS